MSNFEISSEFPFSQAQAQFQKYETHQFKQESQKHQQNLEEEQDYFQPLQMNSQFMHEQHSKEDQFNGGYSLSENGALSPTTNASGSYLLSSQNAYSPQPQNAKPYTNQNNTKSMKSHFSSVETQQKSKSNEYQQVQKPSSQLSEYPTQKQQICNDEILLLKQHLKQKFKNYSEQEIEEIINKFINEYLYKLQNQTSDTLEQQEQQIDDGRSSLSSTLDWNDRSQLEKYCSKQKRIEKEEGFRPSQYFGAISVEELEDGIGDPKIDQLFSECFGIKPKPKQKKQTKTKQQSQNNQQQTAKCIKEENNMPLQNKINGNNNAINNDQSCKINNQQFHLNINFNKLYMIDSTAVQPQEGSKVFVINQENDQFGNFVIPQDMNAYEDNEAITINEKPLKKQQSQTHESDHHQAPKSNVFSDKSNKIQNQPNINCQILHSEQQNTGHMNKLKNSHQDSLQKYMSPQEIQKIKHLKNQSQQIAETENNFDSGFCYKTADPRQQLSQTSMNSPQSVTTSASTFHFSKHIQQLSNLIGTNGQLPKDSNSKNPHLSHQSSIHSQNQKVKHSQNGSQTKQGFKGILYKQQSQHNPNVLSITSVAQIENKPKQMNKLSYINQKQLQENGNTTAHNHNTSELNLQNPPKPQSGVEAHKLNAKNQRDSQQNSNFRNSINENLSPIKPQFQVHTQSNPSLLIKDQISQQMQPLIQSKILNNKYNSLLAQSVDISAFQQQTQRDDQMKSGASTQRSNVVASKAFGRNNSQFFKTASINNAQSFLTSPTSESDNFNQHHFASIQYMETDGTQSPVGLQTMKSVNVQSFNSSGRPQTAISNQGVATGINSYLNNVNQLNCKPPSKSTKQLGFLSHNSSAKNLKLMSQNLTINTQQVTLTQNSSRKAKNETEIQDYPKSSRNNTSKYNSKPASLSKERINNTKSNERNTKKTFVIETENNESHDKKRHLYKTSKQNTTSYTKASQLCASGSQKAFSKQAVTRNHNMSGVPKGNSTNIITDYLKNSKQTIENSQKQDSSNKTIQRIGKSLDKIKQIFMNNCQQPPTIPQSTKHSTTNEFKTNELFQQINSYKNFIKKTNPSIEQKPVSLKSKVIQNVQLQNSKDSFAQGFQIDSSSQAAKKKSTESFKKYLSGTLQNPGFHSFK